MVWGTQDVELSTENGAPQVRSPMWIPSPSALWPPIWSESTGIPLRPWPTHQFLFLLVLFHFRVTEHIQHTRLWLGMEDPEMDEKPPRVSTRSQGSHRYIQDLLLEGRGTSQTVKRGYFSGSWAKWRLIFFYFYDVWKGLTTSIYPSKQEPPQAPPPMLLLKRSLWGCGGW